MNILKTDMYNLSLETPNPERDAPFAYGWFASGYGADTLLKMGNAPHEISEPSLEGERRTLQEFLDLEKDGKQKTWMIRYEDETIGAAWIDLIENHGVTPPSLHLMIGDPSYRDRGIGHAVMSRMLEYLKTSEYTKVYSRHLASNTAIIRLNATLGFEKDGGEYVDENGLVWQNISMDLA